MPFILILIILALLTESFATSWYSGAVHSKVSEKPPYGLPPSLALIKSVVFALGIISGRLGSVALPWYYTTMAYALMFIIGLKLITETMRFHPEERIVLVDNNKTLLILSVAGSFNTLFIGISLGLIGTGIWAPVLTMFAGTLVFSFISLYLGKKYGLRPFIRLAGIAAGSLIAFVALRFFVLYFI
ncbi:MAG: manganese efflux pump [Chloroflexota bacterium]|nr:manganese efflux pump [Lentimicrobium sp.]